MAQTRVQKFLKKIVALSDKGVYQITPAHFTKVVKEGSARKSQKAVISTQLSVLKRKGLLENVGRATYEPTDALYDAYDRAFA